jgi:rhodanese-related sulfurtransferase
VRALTAGMPAAPDHFSRCSAINRQGPALMEGLAGPVPLGPEAFADRRKAGDAVLLDVRGYPAFSGLHIPGAWHLDLAGNFATNAGWVLPPGREILLVVEDERQVDEAVLGLRRVGFDRITAFLDGGMLAWGTSGLPTARVPVISPGEAHARLSSGEAVLLDVRSVAEWRAAHAAQSVHIPWHDLRTRHADLDPARQYIVMCKGGQRASSAAGILMMHGFLKIANLAGGYDAYRRAGFAP